MLRPTPAEALEWPAIRGSVLDAKPVLPAVHHVVALHHAAAVHVGLCPNPLLLSACRRFQAADSYQAAALQQL